MLHICNMNNDDIDIKYVEYEDKYSTQTCAQRITCMQTQILHKHTHTNITQTQTQIPHKHTHTYRNVYTNSVINANKHVISESVPQTP